MKAYACIAEETMRRLNPQREKLCSGNAAKIENVTDLPAGEHAGQPNCNYSLVRSEATLRVR
jgi:hypothetical protein